MGWKTPPPPPSSLEQKVVLTSRLRDTPATSQPHVQGSWGAQRRRRSRVPPREQIEHEAPICVILFPIASLANECHKYQAVQKTNYLLY